MIRSEEGSLGWEESIYIFFFFEEVGVSQGRAELLQILILIIISKLILLKIILITVEF
jgi:hypothetical protein